jgi:hypothetical protein
MCPHTLKKRLKPLAKSSRTKQYCKSSYTIPEKPPEEKVVNKPRQRQMPFNLK